MWRQHLNLDLPNIRTALEWSLRNDLPIGLELAAALRRYWEGHSPLQEGINWLEHLLHDSGAAAASATRAKALTAVGWLNAWQQAYPTARVQAEEALAIYRGLGDHRGAASALFVVGCARCLQEGYAAGRPIWLESLALYRTLDDPFGSSEVLAMLGAWESNRDYAQARTYLEEGLMLCRALGDSVGMSTLLDSLGEAALRHGDFAAAHAWLTEALALQRTLGITSVASVLGTLGELALAQGAYVQAQAYFEESLMVCRESGQTMIGMWSLVRLGYVALRQGEVEPAGALLLDGLHRFTDAGDRIGTVYTLEGLASLAVAHGQFAQAVRMFGWADTMRAALRNPRPPIDQADVDRDLASIRTHLDQAVIAAVWADGQAMTLEDVITYALSSTEGDVPSSAAVTGPQ